MTFEKPTKVWIGSIDRGAGEKSRGGLSVEAQYNPGTLEIGQNVPWKKPDAASKGGGKPKPGDDPSRNDQTLEFSGAEGRTISLELLFDGVETNTSVKDTIDTLEELAAVQQAGGLEKDRRPHHCVVVWQNVLPRFKCVIESLTTKYTMFATNGTPLRATCTLKLKEADKVQRAKEAAAK